MTRKSNEKKAPDRKVIQAKAPGALKGGVRKPAAAPAKATSLDDCNKAHVAEMYRWEDDDDACFDSVR